MDQLYTFEVYLFLQPIYAQCYENFKDQLIVFREISLMIKLNHDHGREEWHAHP